MFSSIASSQNSSLERLGQNCENIIIAKRSKKEMIYLVTRRGKTNI